MHKWHAFLLYISEDGDLSPKHTRQFICMDKIRFYINCEHFLVHMDNRVKYFSYIFMCCWPCILVIFDFMFQLNAPFVYYIYHIPLHVSSDIVLIMRRIHCVCVYIYIYIYIYINTASGSLYVTLLRWPLSAQAIRGLASSNYLCPERSLKKSDIQRTRCCMYTVNPPDDEHNVARNM